MKKFIRNVLAVFAACGLATTAAMAQVPSGTYDFVMDAPESAIYDFGGVRTFEQYIIGAGGEPVNLSYGVELVHAATGTLRGEGNVMVAIGSDVVAAYCKAKGNVFGGGTKETQVTLSVTLKGEDVIGGKFTRFQIDLKYKLFVDPIAGELYGTVSGKANMKGIGNMKVSSEVAMPVPTSGAWALHVDITPLAKLVGPGTLTLSNGRQLPLHASGKYKASTDTSSIELRSQGEEKGSAFKVVFSLSEGLLDMSGTVLGQKLVEPMGY
jgi:hypothetical protein